MCTMMRLEIESTPRSSDNEDGLSELAKRATMILAQVQKRCQEEAAAAAVATAAAAAAAVAAASAAAANANVVTTTPSEGGGGSSDYAYGHRSRMNLSPPSSTSERMFPQKVMDVLSDRNVSEIITWLPHGRSFVVLQPDLLVEVVLPKHNFPAAKYTSFTRRLNRWGFRQVTQGSDAGSFQHHLFRRDKPDLCLQMDCKKNAPSVKRESSKCRRLPPKKRLKSSRSTNNAAAILSSYDTIAPTSLISEQGVTSSCSSLTAAADDFSASTNTVASNEDALPPSERGVWPSSTTLDSSFWGIGVDQSVISHALQQRERVRTAQEMLYEAYQKALYRQD